MAKTTGLSEEVIKQALGEGAKFVLVELLKDGPKPLYDHRGQLLKFEDGDQANAAAARYSEDRYVKVQPRRIIDPNWRDREDKRLKDGTYVPLPWADQKWWTKDLGDIHKDHFPHASLGKVAMIAYTESADKGSADIQTQIKPGRYLEANFPMLNSYMVRDLCAVFSSKFEDNKLLMAETADEIEEIYLNGPSSCMTKSPGSYPTQGIHPVRMYAAGDLAVAYIMRQGRIAARAVVWPAKKVYNTIYGDSSRLRPLLEKQGYKSGSLAGAKLSREKVKSKSGAAGRYCFVLPHVDNTTGVKDGGDHLVIQEGEKTPIYTAGGGAGISEEVGFKCAKCDKDSIPGRGVCNIMITRRVNEHWCLDCRNKHAVACQISGAYVPRDHAIQYGARNSWCWKEFEKDLVKCDATGHLYPSSQVVTLYDGRRWNVNYFSGHGRHCGCGALVPTSVYRTCSSEGCVSKRHKAKDHPERHAEGRR